MQGGKREESNKKLKRTATVGHISSTSWSPFHAYYILFRISGSRESNASNGAWIGAETKKLWLFEDNRIKLCENFAAQSPFCSREMGYEMKSTCKILQGVSQLWNPPLAHECHFAAPPPSFRNYKMGCKMACKNVPWLRNGLQTVNQVANHLQVAESPPSCEITNSNCKIKVQTWKMDNSMCEIHLCNIRYLLSTKLDFFSQDIFCKFLFSPCNQCGPAFFTCAPTWSARLAFLFVKN